MPEEVRGLLSGQEWGEAFGRLASTVHETARCGLMVLRQESKIRLQVAWMLGILILIIKDTDKSTDKSQSATVCCTMETPGHVW